MGLVSESGLCFCESNWSFDHTPNGHFWVSSLAITRLGSEKPFSIQRVRFGLLASLSSKPSLATPSCIPADHGAVEAPRPVLPASHRQRVSRPEVPRLVSGRVG